MCRLLLCMLVHFDIIFAAYQFKLLVNFSKINLDWDVMGSWSDIALNFKYH